MKENYMLEKEVKIDLLHAALINKDFVTGENNCDYEQYLFEVIQMSQYFKTKSNNKQYSRPVSEAHGECDCVSDDYELDFKLLATSTRLQASKELTASIHSIGNGATMVGAPRRPNTQMTVVQLHAAIRPYSLNQLETILNGTYAYGTIECDIKTYLEKLMIQKNLFLFFPFKFNTDNKYDFDIVIDYLINALNSDFKESIKFRNKNSNNFDTYFAFVYENKLIILEFNSNDKMEKIEVIDLFNSPTYKYLYNRYVNTWL